MGILIISNFISKEDVLVINEYISTINFHTRDSHVPLHDQLYEKYNAPFDLHTRGEMPKHILEVFSKYSKEFYDIINEIHPGQYLPAMFSKHYIARYNTGTEIGPQFDNSKPEGTYKSLIYWNNDFDGGKLNFPNLKLELTPNPGDLIFFLENEENKYSIEKITSGKLYQSEVWMGKIGKLWMPSKDTYEEIDWNNWEIKGF